MKKLLNFALATTVTASTLLAAPSAHAQIFGRDFRAGMDRCEGAAARLTKSERAVVFKKNANAKLVDVIAIDGGRASKLGTLTVAQVESLKPELRQWASGGLTVVYVGTALLSAGVYAFAGAMTAFESAAGAASALKGIALIGGTELAIGSGLQFLDVLNPVAQFERANVEKCLATQISKISDNGEAIVVRMNDKDDFSDTVGALRDLISDLKN